MTETRKKLYLTVPFRVHQLARVGAAALGTSMSEYVSCLVLGDATRRGIDEFVRKSVSGDDDDEGDPELDGGGQEGSLDPHRASPSPT